jgi:hypothetical protein
MTPVETVVPAPEPDTADRWGLSTRPWPHDEAERRRILRALRFEHFKWDAFSAGGFTLLPELLVVPDGLHRRVVEAVEGLAAGLVALRGPGAGSLTPSSAWGSPVRSTP